MAANAATLLSEGLLSALDRMFLQVEALTSRHPGAAAPATPHDTAFALASVLRDTATQLEEMARSGTLLSPHHGGGTVADANSQPIVSQVPTPTGANRPPPVSCRDESESTVSHEAIITPSHRLRSAFSPNASVTSDFLLASVAIRTSLHIGTDAAGFDTVNTFTILKEIGCGANAHVLLCSPCNSDELRAIKVIPRTCVVRNKAREGMIREVAVMKKLQHKNIVRLYECIDDPKEDNVYLVMQYVEGGPVMTFNENFMSVPLSLTTVQKYMRQLAAAVHYIHRRGVVHRDIKPDNILVDVHGNLFLSDFGVSELIEADCDRTSSQCGTPLFFAPEILENKPSGAAGDMWAVGVTLYAMVFGQLPFHGDSFTDIFTNIKELKLTFPPASPAKVKWMRIIRRLLHPNPAKRMTAAQLRSEELLTASLSDAPEGEPESPAVVESLEPTQDELRDAIDTNRMSFAVEERNRPRKARFSISVNGAPPPAPLPKVVSPNQRVPTESTVHQP